MESIIEFAISLHENRCEIFNKLKEGKSPEASTVP